MDIIKVGILGVAAVLMAIPLRKEKQEFAVNVCRDSGYGAIAGQIENFAKMSILVVSLPVLMAFIDTVGSLL